jgi:esterase/lipase
MTRAGRVFGVALLGLAAVALAGPRPVVSPPDAAAIAAALPVALDSLAESVRAREAAVPGLVFGTDARVTFIDGPQRTRDAVVYLHGFSATRQETAPLSELIAESIDANLFEARLRGHGVPGERMGDATAEDWLADAAEAIAIGRRLGDSVIVVATSTGATLALWHALADSATVGTDVMAGVRAFVLISPNLGPRDRTAELLTLPWMSAIVPRIMPVRRWEPANAEQGQVWTVAYSSRALFPMQALVEDVRDRDVRRLAIPTLVFLNDADPVIDAARVHDFFDGAPAGRVDLVSYDPPAGNDAHVLAGRIVSPDGVTPLLSRTLGFLGGVRRAPPSAGAPSHDGTARERTARLALGARSDTRAPVRP